MSFTDGKPFVATEEDCHESWMGGADGKHFRCHLCGYKFKPKDVVRWQFTNHIPGAGGNPLVCQSCDGPDVVERWKKMREVAKMKFWWFARG